MPQLNKNVARQKRHTRLRKRTAGTAERPRLNVYRSSNNIYAQVIDDLAQRTLAAASSLDSTIRQSDGGRSVGGNVGAAKLVGKLIAERAKAAEEAGIALAHIEKNQQDPKRAYEDIVWALINTKEFLFNH